MSADDGAAGADFGGTLVLNGETALIGAKFDDAKATDSGSAYVLVRTASNWSQQKKMTASDGAATDLFGVSVALSGEAALIGASLDDDAGSNAGSAYVFVRAAKNWSALQELTAADAAIGDGLGGAVALGGDTGLIGGVGHDHPESASGSAYVVALLLADGESCDGDGVCASKFCVGGYWCDRACSGECEACNLSGTEGVCSLVSRGGVLTGFSRG